MITLEEFRSKQIYLIGIGGAGMSGIARIMIDQGFSVSGSDARDSPVLASLSKLGATIHVGHAAENINGADLVVTSGAISQSNVELRAAHLQRLPILARAEALAILMSESISVAVAGTHGKTTTTSMLTVALQHSDLDPSFAIGGMLNSSGTNAHLGSGKIFVAEADESDGSLLVYRPFGAIITNIELDHVDHFADYAAVLAIFLEFVATIQQGGFLVACNDDVGVRDLLSKIKRTDLSILTYGVEGNFVISRTVLLPESSTALISYNGSILGELSLQVPGEHNLANALAALAAGVCLGANPQTLLDGMHSFSGTRRRFEFKGEARGIRVIDDYGHHPTEIAVTLETARRYAGTGRLLVIFQPHRYSRTKAFAVEFASALSAADLLFLLEVYPASEAPIPGVTSALIAKSIDPSKVLIEPSMISMVVKVVLEAKSGDVILTLGAGDVSSLAPVIVNALSE